MNEWYVIDFASLNEIISDKFERKIDATDIDWNNRKWLHLQTVSSHRTQPATVSIVIVAKIEKYKFCNVFLSLCVERFVQLYGE